MYTCYTKYYCFFLQVKGLFAHLEIAEYDAKLKNASITGKLLLQCDDASLRDDLGISSRVNRLLLLQIITGKLCLHSL